MAQGFAYCVLVLYLLFSMHSNSGNGHKEIADEHDHQQKLSCESNQKCDNNIQQVVDRPPSGNDENHNKATNIENHSHAHHHHVLMSNNMDHFRDTIGLFTIDELHIGKRVAVQFVNKDHSTLPPLLPKEEADRIPFSLNKLPQILQFFSFSHSSQQAMTIEDTIKRCNAKPIEGETNFCATSFESMVHSVSSILGKVHSFKLLKTTHLGKPSELYQNYTFLEVHEVPSPKNVVCHNLPYPYAVFYCHSQNNKVFRILVAGEEEGNRVNGVVVCHMDTSHWPKDHVAFRTLHAKQGTVPVCHFFTNNNIIWVQNVL